MHRFGLQIFAANNALSSDGIINMVCPIVDFRDNADITFEGSDIVEPSLMPQRRSETQTNRSPVLCDLVSSQRISSGQRRAEFDNRPIWNFVTTVQSRNNLRRFNANLTAACIHRGKLPRQAVQ